MWHLYHFLLLLILFVTSCTESGYMEQKNGLVRKGNEIVLKSERCKMEVPTSVEINHNRPKKPPFPDFDIYSFEYNGQTLLVAYFGNHPSGLIDGKEIINQGRINGMEYKYYKSVTDNNYNYLISIPQIDNTGWWPMYCHFWYSGLSPEEERIALNIIHSLKLLE